LAVTCALMLAPTAVAQYAIRRCTIDGGGGTFSTGGTYSLGATIGQADAGPAGGPMIGGTFKLVGGFWSILSAAPVSRFYVSASAAPGGEGYSWATAFNDLQSALAAAAATGTSDEIWVAAGTYMPDGGRTTIGGAHFDGSGDPNASFELIDGVAIYGGFVGTNETALSQRNILGNVTALSGDIYGNDGAGFEGYTDNSYTVVTALSGQDASAVLDGFTVIGATTTFSGANSGVMCVGSSPTLCRCTLSGNLAWLGGGIFCDQAASPTLVNCVIRGNTALYGGGVACRNSSNPTMVNCTVYLNSADFLQGGGVWSESSNPTLANCIVWGNIPDQIRGMVFVSNCDVEGAAWPGAGNISLDPGLTPDGHLIANSQCIDAGSNAAVPPTLTVDLDNDSRIFPASGVVDIGADEFKDTDGDGLPDWWESRYFGSPAGANAGTDDDGDCISNIQEYEEYGGDPTRPPLLVPSVSYPTVQAALDAADDGDTVIVASGVYSGSGYTNLDFKNHAVVLRGPCSPPAPPNAVTIDCQNQPNTRLAIPTSIPTRATEHGNVVIEGITVTGGAADFGAGINTGSARLLLKNCTLQNNAATSAAGALYSDRSVPLKLDGLTIGSNNTPSATAGVVRSGTVQLQGALNITSGTLQTLSTTFWGALGTIQLSPPGIIQVSGTGPAARATTIRTNVSGSGDIVIDLGQTLSIENGAIVDLSGQAIATQPCGSPCPSSDPSTWGRITVNGTLLVSGSTVRNTNVDVKLASFHGATQIFNNDIRLLNSSTGWGGELFVEGGSTIQCNKITSDGDRYLDLDPDPTSLPHPEICNNKIEVVIKQGANLELGELLELRSQDFDTGGPGNPTGESGAYPVPPESAGFTANPDENNNWSLERLEIQTGAKLNLTDRQGFEFHGPGTPETLYVKDVILHPNAVLNTALQTLYYNNLKLDDGNGNLTPVLGGPPYPDPMPNGGRIIDIPLLGFSLKVIRMEHDDEFEVRVRLRKTDPTDANPLPPADPIFLGDISRITNPNDEGDGVMEMRTRADGAQSATSVAAHGAFARAGEDEILIRFDYLFGGQPTDELIVYLTDRPDVSENENLVEVARIVPPNSGPGSIGSNAYATFSGRFPRETLNFLRGTYVELELRGADARIWIDDWDPAVCIWAQCGDLSGDIGNTVTEVDYLYLLSEYGNPVNDLNGCADEMNADNYVDLSDLNAWSSQYHNAAVLNLCGNDGGTPGGTVTPVASLPPSNAVVAGKPGMTTLRGTVLQNDKVYAVDDQNQMILGSDDAPAQHNGVRSGHGHLITDPSGELYQVHGAIGLIRLSDGQVVLSARTLTNCPSSGHTTRVGITASGGFPFADVAFDPNDPDIVYVAPVQVDPPQVCSPPAQASPGCPYRAAARLSLSNASCASITRYGEDPHFGSSVKPPCTPNCDTDPPYVAYHPDRSRVREIEVDVFSNVFVLSAQELNENDYVLIYQRGYPTTGMLFEVLISDDVESPAAMHVAGDKLYLTTALDGPDDDNTVIHRYSIIRSGDLATGLAHDATINIPGMRFITSIDTNPADGQLWAVGFSAQTCSTEECRTTNPNCPFGCTYDEGDPIFTTPMMALITNPDTASTVDQVFEVTNTDLALPLGLAFPSAVPQCGTGDYDGGGTGYSDVALFVSALLNPTPETICPGDTNADGDLNGTDIQGFLAELIGL
jgi:hypothetical protein